MKKLELLYSQKLKEEADRQAQMDLLEQENSKFVAERDMLKQFTDQQLSKIKKLEQINESNKLILKTNEEENKRKTKEKRPKTRRKSVGTLLRPTFNFFFTSSRRSCCKFNVKYVYDKRLSQETRTAKKL